MTTYQPSFGTGEASIESPEINHHMPPIEPYTWLLHSNGEKQTFITATPKISSSGYTIHERSIPELRNKTVMVCCHGWVLLSDQATSHNYSLWNPSTLQSIVIPPLNLNRDFLVGPRVLSSPPDTTNSTILLVEEYKPNIVFLRIGRGHEHWIEIQCGEQLVEFSPYQDRDELITFTVCCNGQLYLTTCYGRYLMNVNIVDQEEDMSKIVLTPLVELPSMRTYALSTTTRLVESLGQLFLIYVFFGGVNHDIIAIEVHKLDSGRNQWDKVCTIEDQVFFLGFRFSFSWTALSELDRGCLYFGEYCYNIENKCLSVASPSSTSSTAITPSSTSVVPNNHWIREHEAMGKDASGDEEAPKQVFEINYTKDYVERNLGDFPEALIGEISYHLTSFTDYMNFRSVSRVFSSAAPATKWRKKTSLEKHRCPCPWLMICSDSREEYTFIEPRFSERYFMRIPEELADTTVHCAKDGWLLMSRDDDTMFFFNPFTKAILTCPTLSLGYQSITYIMSSAPTCSNNLAMAITTEEEEAGVRLYTIANGDGEWQYRAFLTEIDFVPNHNPPVVTDYGFYYFLGQKGNLLNLAREDGCWNYEVSNELKALCQSFCDLFLVECNERTFAIFVGDQGKWVRVFIHELQEYEDEPHAVPDDEDELTMFWLEVESIGKWTMFLSRSSCFSVVAEYEEMGERIYFPRLHKGSLVFYSLKTGNFHSNNGEETLIDYADTAELLLCCWTESRWN